ncbi:hypothetical protein KDN24_07010 [Bacillus sp. Bva_UNVM-123]|uniref:hypothetical protein n=1 Tax=Bacillus sp. Bva_UNVM-123 TaxID=2829798 RepID=UPI00391F6E79
MIGIIIGLIIFVIGLTSCLIGAAGWVFNENKHRVEYFLIGAVILNTGGIIVQISALFIK